MQKILVAVLLVVGLGLAGCDLFDGDGTHGNATPPTSAIVPAVADVPAPAIAVVPSVTTPAIAPVVPTSTISGTAELVAGILSALVAAFLVPFLKRKAEAAKAEAEKLRNDALCSEMDARSKLIERVKSFLFGSAAAICEKEFPKIAADVIAGELKTSEDVKRTLHSLGATLKADALEYFGNQGIDLLAAVGGEYLDKLIERVANSVSPFPGRDTASMFLQTTVSNLLIENGVNWIRSKYLTNTSSADAAMNPV